MDDNAGGANRLFHAIVLMGGSLALACGGNVAGAEDDSTAQGEAGQGGNKNVRTSAGGASAGGASSGTGTATAPPTGGAPPAIGGSGAQPGGTGGGEIAEPIADVPSLDCPFEQWSCAGLEPPHCRPYNVGYVFPDHCQCDPERPVGSEDCGDDEVLICDLATDDSAGVRFDEPFAFNCTCIDSGLYCDEACIEVSDQEDRFMRSCLEERSSGDLTQYLCGCAVIVPR